MPDKFQNKYRIPSARLQTWDYGSEGMYFITICTKNRKYYFGDVVDRKMQLSEIGKIVASEWLKTFDMRKDMNLIQDEFIVMPNHFHAILIIGENQYNAPRDIPRRGTMHCASTDVANVTNNINETQSQNKFGPQSKNLASIVRGFKIAVTTNARILNANFAWQPLYHDHIIRNDESYERIRNYIINNPSNWEGDKFYNR